MAVSRMRVEFSLVRCAIVRVMPASRRVLVPTPGISILAIDPGKTTGIAIWDAWCRKLYVDHIDAGRGRKVRHRVQAGVIESASRRAAELALCETKEDINRVRTGNGLRKGKQGSNETISIVERGVVTILCDLVMALGPRTVVVMEDFVLGATGGGAYGGRDGLSPVRIAHRFDERAWDMGLFSGDAWRNWVGHGWAGADRRGWKVEQGIVPEYRKRLADVELWRLYGRGDAFDEGFEGGAVWNGAGAHMEWQMPSSRSFLKGGVAPMKDWLRKERVDERGSYTMWIQALPHGMDALMHACVFSRKISAEILEKPERLYIRSERKRNEGQ